MLTNTIKVIKSWERSLDRYPRTDIKIKVLGSIYEPQVTVRSDDYIEFCNHVKSGVEEVQIATFDPDSNQYIPDDSEFVTICEVCDKQLIGGEWL